MIRGLVEKPGTVFALVWLWKAALLLFTAQPVPNNDSFFYDGPVVNYLLHGRYCNPSLVHALPISGGEVFSAYPPLYQPVLLGWMRVFGTSALAAMWLHVALLAGYFLTVLRIFRHLDVPGRWVNVAGLFLFGITFHDRPDTVAHVLGALAVLGLVRRGGTAWRSALALVLAFCASLQIGAVYTLWCGLIVIGNVWTGKGRFPWGAVVAGGVALAGLVALVKFGYPQLWAGFEEHARLTPSVTGWRVPRVVELLKAARTAPAVGAVGLALLWAVWKGRLTRAAVTASPAGLVAVAGTLAALALIAVSLVVLTPNTIHIANYIQPVVVGTFLSAGMFFSTVSSSARGVGGVFLALALLTAVRAIGMTTWGVLCARDVNYAQATARIWAEVEALPRGSTVIASAAYLYDLARRQDIRWIHNDWPAAPAAGEQWMVEALGRLRPRRVIVTQFDFYRRYATVFELLKSRPDLDSLRITNTATIRAPDSFPQMQRVVQHVSWAPIVAELTWK